VTASTELPAEIAAAIVRGVGAYMRATQPRRLPPELRRLKTLRPQTLQRHTAVIVAALEDDALRASILEWLSESRTPLSKDDADLLRTACERLDDWIAQLAKRSPEEPSEDVDDEPERARLEASLEREQERSRRIRADAQRAKEEARRSVEVAVKRHEELERELKETVARATRREEELAAARREMEAVRDRAARERRGDQRAALRAREEAEAARADSKALRKELASARRHIAQLERQLAARAPRAATVPNEPVRRTGKRGPLRVPKGRMPEEPETLEEWLSAAGVRLLVDGYNVTKAEGGFGGVELERQRQRLIEEVGRLAVRKSVPATIVFDGASVPPGTQRPLRGRVRVEYSAPGETADDHLIADLEAGSPHPVVVVTNDRDLQRRAAEMGATIATSNQLLAILR
jgi:predicted RNA-binding protein with PIN domain